MVVYLYQTARSHSAKDYTACKLRFFLFYQTWYCSLKLQDVINIQGDSEERSVFFGGDSIGHCEKEVLMNLCLVLTYRDRAV